VIFETHKCRKKNLFGGTNILRHFLFLLRNFCGDLHAYLKLNLSHLQELDEMKQGVLISVVLNGVSIAIVKGIFEVYLFPTTLILVLLGKFIFFVFKILLLIYYLNISGDITKEHSGAIVNASNGRLYHAGYVVCYRIVEHKFS
jgi:uncharacterized membrane protein YvlD (DUF360 family)